MNKGDYAIYDAQQQRDWSHLEITDEMLESLEGFLPDTTREHFEQFKDKYGRYPRVTGQGRTLDFQKTIDRKKVAIDLNGDFAELRKAIKTKYETFSDKDFKSLEREKNVQQMFNDIYYVWKNSGYEITTVATILGVSAIVGGIAFCAAHNYFDCLSEARAVIGASNDIDSIEGYNKHVGVHTEYRPHATTSSNHVNGVRTDIVMNASTKDAIEDFTKHVLRYLKKDFTEDGKITKSDLQAACEKAERRGDGADKTTHTKVVSVSDGKVVVEITTNSRSSNKSKTVTMDILFSAVEEYSNIPGVQFSWNESKKRSGINYQWVLNG